MGGELSSLTVCLMGMGIVFIGLICIVILCKLVSVVCRLFDKEEPAAESASAVQTSAAPSADEIPNRGAFIAAVSAVLAEELGKDVSAIRILSVKKI